MARNRRILGLDTQPENFGKNRFGPDGEILTMDKELISRKTVQLERALSRIAGHIGRNSASFSTDYDAQDIVYRNFQIVVQNCVDIASHIIAAEKFEIPRTMGESFDILNRHGIIPAAMAKELRNMTVLRNIIVHDYTRIKIEKAYPLLKNSLKALPKFCRTIFNRSKLPHHKSKNNRKI